MSDDERMDRARRIRQMREGHRGDDPDEESTTEDEETVGSSAEEQTAVDNDTATDATESEHPPGSTNGEEPPSSATASTDETTGTVTDEPPVTEPEIDDATMSSSSDSTADEGETAEIEGPASSGEWFEDEGTETTASAAAESEPPGGSDSDDGDTAQTAASAASAAAAFEVDEDQQRTEATDTDASTVAEESDAEAEQEEEIRVLEFRLGDEHYCLDIQHVEEIVKEESVTRVPNTPEHVHGVVDLRGQITTILDPKIALDIDEDDDEQLIVVFDAETFEDQGHAGWIVDEVRQVLPITESEVKESPLNRKAIKGVIERDEEFVIWTTPQVALEQAEE